MRKGAGERRESWCCWPRNAGDVPVRELSRVKVVREVTRQVSIKECSTYHLPFKHTHPSFLCWASKEWSEARRPLFYLSWESFAELWCEMCHPIQVSQDCHNKELETEWLRNLQSEVKSWFLVRVMRKTSWPLLAAGGLLAAWGIPWLVTASLPCGASIFILIACRFVSVSNFSFL